MMVGGGHGERRASTTRSSASASPEYYSKIQILRINGLRSLTATLSGHEGRSASPRSARTNKMFWSEMHQRAMELALDICGADGRC